MYFVLSFLELESALHKVEELGLIENTIIIFQSDNGYSTEERAHFGGGSSGKFRGTKFSMFEGGIRVPAAISWPAKLKAGEVRNQMAVNADWMPTLAELCNINLNTDDLDGKSLMPILYEKKYREQSLGRFLLGKWKKLGGQKRGLEIIGKSGGKVSGGNFSGKRFTVSCKSKK